MEKSLSDKLDDIAHGRAFSLFALEQAKTHDVTTGNDVDMLRRFMHGTATAADSVALQELAQYIREFEEQTK